MRESYDSMRRAHLVPAPSWSRAVAVMPLRRIVLLSSLLAVGMVACRRTPSLRPSPQRRMATDTELAIYRVLTESTYVRSTGRPVTVVATTLDSACAGPDCAPLERRWGVESPWWAGVADSQ